MHETHAAKSCAWVFELAGEVYSVRLEQTDTGATARHATTHATEGGGDVDLLHLEIEANGVAGGCQVVGLGLVGGGQVDVVDDDHVGEDLGGLQFEAKLVDEGGEEGRAGWLCRAIFCRIRQLLWRVVEVEVVIAV